MNIEYIRKKKSRSPSIVQKIARGKEISTEVCDTSFAIHDGSHSSVMQSRRIATGPLLNYTERQDRTGPASSSPAGTGLRPDPKERPLDLENHSWIKKKQ